MRKFNFVLLTCLLLSAIMLCVGCEPAPKSQPNARWRAEICGSYNGNINVYEVVIDGQSYLVTTGYHCVNTIPKTVPPQVAERQ